MSRARDAAALLSSLADALTACEKAGLKVRLRHGVVITREGYVLPAGKRWEPRTLLYTEFSPPDDGDGDG